MDQIHLSNQSSQRLPIILALSLFIFFHLTFTQPIIARPGWIQTTLTIEIQAHIDGEDILIIDDNTLRWHHLTFAAVGRHEGGNQPTTISTTHARWCGPNE